MLNLKKPYERDDFVNFLQSDFLPSDYEPDETIIDYTKNKTSKINKIVSLGICKSLKLQVLEIHHSSVNDARVSITKEIFQFIKQNRYYNCLVLLVPNDNCDVYRFSFVKLSPKMKNERIDWEHSNPKRYSFLLGVNQHTKTPEKYLSKRINNIESLEECFSVEVLTKEFYNELFNWYEWALSSKNGFKVTYPNDTCTDTDDRDHLAEHLIRLITRLMFVWFIKQKNLVPNCLFDENTLKNEILVDFNCKSKKESNYYNAILQNLFFATLNMPIKERKFAPKTSECEIIPDESYGIKTLYRDNDKSSWFKISHTEIANIFKKIPYINGGLFECLDKEKDEQGKIYYFDGFSRSDCDQCRAFLPNCLFFEDEIEVKSEVDKKQRTVSGIINILKKYNFTTEENTPEDIEVALDPELLGKVFESLLGAYNPETKETARKATGSFYTPREIVNYMVEESLNAYLKTKVGENYQDKPEETKTALEHIKIIDPACGSGAFPMGILNAIVNKLRDIDNEINIYQTKLNLIKDCIYGVDIQPIAVQICKLRFFISLICDQNKTNDENNYGIEQLPNLETKFVSANSLIGFKGNKSLGDKPLKDELDKLRDNNFSIHDPKEKSINRAKDKELRNKLKQEMSGLTSVEIEKMVDWNPYDQNKFAEFFDPKWMFGKDLKDGFDIVIGNPPYVSNKKTDPIYAKIYGFSDDLYNYFFIRSMELCKQNTGILSFITSNTFLTLESKHNIRNLLQKHKILVLNDLGAGIFLGAVVNTVISIVQKEVRTEDYLLKYVDSRNNFENPEENIISINIFKNNINSVFFTPNKTNLTLQSLYGEKLKMLYTMYWPMISSAKNIAQNTRFIEEYRKSLKPGDITLLGLLTEGGVGLQTANNGKYIAVMDGTKFADNIRDSRPKKLKEVYDKYKISELKQVDNFTEFLSNKTEQEISNLFDNLKEKYGRDIFGQGYLFKIITQKDVANPDNLSQIEKEKGIDKTKPHYVIYDKGDKDGNRWYLESPYYISWTKENVHYLKTNSGKKGEGMPVVRNPQFYFNEGFCWTNVLMPTNEESKYIKCRLKGKSINDVASMSLYNKYDKISNLYIVALLNSSFMYNYLKEFINNTVNLQINDFRQLPIVIPSVEQLNLLNNLAKQSIIIKQSIYTDGNDNGKQIKLKKLQSDLEKITVQLYKI